MAGVAGGVLAAEVHKAGGVGLIGAGHLPLDNLEAEVAKARQQLGLTEDNDLPIGAGLILWRLEAPHLVPPLAAAEPDRWLRYIIHSARMSVLWLSFSADGDLGGWVKRARRIEAEGAKGSERGRARRSWLRIVVMAQTEDMARTLTQQEGVDAVVLQGTEAGGHGPTYEQGLPLDTLISRFSSHLPSTHPPFLLAAGGLASPTSVSRVLALGIAAVVPGTALSVASESLLPQKQKELLVRTRMADDTGRGLAWDLARGTNGWPAGVDGRAVRNLTSEGDKAAGDLRAETERYARAMKEGDVERVVTWAGALPSLTSDDVHYDMQTLQVPASAT
ncbi:nitronate monooxygenase [Rhodotorula paludigena]|uniref:nitronate monooxygenase n=1 Tax=Rhodotorula paludigena TaxID=86838 RepID=UPI00316E2E72